MRLFLLLFCLLLSLLPAVIFAQSANQPGQYQFENWFETREFSPYSFVNGQTAGMGLLDFTVSDSTGDLFRNSAKNYRGSGSRLIISPSYTGMSMRLDREQRIRQQFGENQTIETSTINNRNTYNTFFLPLGLIYETGSFYAGGLITFSNFSNDLVVEEQTTSAGNVTSSNLFTNDENVSGRPFHLIAGYHLSDDITISLFYKRMNLDRDNTFINRSNQITSESENTFRSEFMGTGIGFSVLNGKSYLLAGLYSNRSENREEDSAGRFWSEADGFTLEYEHLQPLTETLSAGLKATFSRRNIDDRTTQNIFDQYDARFNTTGIGAGINKRLSSTVVAAELFYTMSEFRVDQEQTFTQDGISETTQTVNQNFLILRAGIDTPFYSDIRLQAGIQHTFIDRSINFSDSATLEDQLIFESNFTNNPLSKESLTRFTSGLTYSLASLDFIYSLNVELRPQNIVFSQNESNNNLSSQFVNQISVSYRF